eukprot:151294-Chlamydomonas_euryale.AAC.1
MEERKGQGKLVNRYVPGTQNSVVATVVPKKRSIKKWYGQEEIEAGKGQHIRRVADAASYQVHQAGKTHGGGVQVQTSGKPVCTLYP